MTQQPRTRQELYNLVRQKGKDVFILDEMIRLGFWPVEGEMPKDPADDIRRMGEIRKELNELRQESRHLHDEKILRKRLLKERLAESRRKQQENKEKRERERIERAEAWQQKKQQDIVYLGEGVSAGLNYTDCDEEKLRFLSLPVLGSGSQIATAMGITVGELRFLAFNRKTATVSHYIRFKMPKKTGGGEINFSTHAQIEKGTALDLASYFRKISTSRCSSWVQARSLYCHER